MIEKSVGSRSIKMALCSSLRLEMRPLRRAVKKVSGIHVSVCRDVEKLWIVRWSLHASSMPLVGRNVLVLCSYR